MCLFRSSAGTVRGARPRAQLALLDGVVGAVWAPGGRPRMAFAFTTAHGMIVEIELLADPDRLRRLDLTVLDGRPGRGVRATERDWRAGIGRANGWTPGH